MTEQKTVAGFQVVLTATVRGEENVVLSSARAGRYQTVRMVQGYGLHHEDHVTNIRQALIVPLDEVERNGDSIQEVTPTLGNGRRLYHRQASTPRLIESAQFHANSLAFTAAVVLLREQEAAKAEKAAVDPEPVLKFLAWAQTDPEAARKHIASLLPTLFKEP